MRLLPDTAFSDASLQNISSLALAHIGDAVFELLARTLAVSSGGLTPDKLHKLTVSLVAAPAQARCAKRIEPHLTEDERTVLTRGRNAHSRTIPKGASAMEYRLSTALEALFGHLYLKGEIKRITELFEIGMEDSDAS